MANGAVPIADARRIGEARGVPMIVIFNLEPDASRFGVTTWGRNLSLCKLAADFGRQFSEAVLNGKVEPADVPPEVCPMCHRDWEVPNV